MRTENDGRGRALINPNAAEVVNGQQSLDDWDDEELLRGRRRNRKGGFRGPDPAVMPSAMVRELQRRRFAKASALLAHSLVDAVKLLRSIVNDERAPRGYRIKAAKEILNRVLGLPTERVAVDVSGSDRRWEQVIAHAIVSSDQLKSHDDDDIIDVEAFEDADVVEGEVVEE